MRRLALIWLLLLLSAGLAFAQFDTEQPPADEPPATPTAVPRIIHRRPPTTPAAITPTDAEPVSFSSAHTIMLDVRNLDLDHVLTLLGKTAGITIVKDPDPALSGPVTIISSHPVTIDEAFDLLNSVLLVRGATLVRQGDVMKVTTIGKAISMVSEINVGTDPNAIRPGDRLVTQIIPLGTLDANTISSELAPLGLSEGNMTTHAATNTLYITDTANNIQRFLKIINDLEARNLVSVRVFRLQYVAADDMSDLITSYLGASSTGGATAPVYERNILPNRSNTPGTAAARALAASRNTASAAAGAGTSGVQVTTDTRTNSLIITANPERLDLLGKLIAEFDKPVDYSSTLAVIPLQNARADDLADLLNQSLGGAAKTPARSTATTARTTTGTTNSRLNSGYTSSSLLPDGAAGPNSAGVVTALGNAGADGNVSLAQNTTGTGTTVGRAEGHVVPLIDATGITIVPDPSTNSLVVNAPPEKLELIKAMVKRLDVIPTQVLIQAIIAEVTLTKGTDLGAEFTFLKNNIFKSGADSNASDNFSLRKDSSGADVILSGLKWTLTKGENAALLNALATDSHVRIKSTPRIFTTSGKKADIAVSTQVPFATGQTTYTTGTATSTSFDYKPVGILLEVTPLVSQDGTVTMEISQTADDLLQFVQLSPDLKLPEVAHRELVSVVSVQDGETVVLGGLMSERKTRTDSGIPLLKDLPLIGWAFRNRTSSTEKTELLVFLTPQVVRTPEEARMLTEEQKGATSLLPKIPAKPSGTEH